jgi:transcriptional regulator with XRE-family HTH domain
VTIHSFPTFSAHDETIGGRLSLARDAAQLSTEIVTAKLGISALVWSHWENDRDEPPENYLDPIASILGVTRNWLTTGRGDGPADIYLQ